MQCRCHKLDSDCQRRVPGQKAAIPKVEPTNFRILQVTRHPEVGRIEADLAGLIFEMRLD
jgi:hypothetical protein